MDQPTTIKPESTVDWLNKLIMLAQWNRKLPFHTVRLINDATEYQAFLTRVRASATDKKQLIDTSTETTPVAVARKKLLEAVAAVPALRELFGSDNPFKDAPADHLELLAEVSDVTAESQKMVYSRNGTLEAVMPGVQANGKIDSADLIVNWLNKFLTLMDLKPAEGEKSTAELLYELAMSPHWYVVMASLRADRDYARDDEQVVSDTLKRWNEIVTKQSLQTLFRTHLSKAPKKLIQLAWEHREIFEEAREKSGVPKKYTDDQRKLVIDAAYLLFQERFKTQLGAIIADLDVLVTVGNHFVSVRKFAKLDGFVYTWPEIARLGMANYTALKHVEELVLNRMPRPTDADLDAYEARELYGLVDSNERFKRFMSIKPRFSQIDEKEFMQYRPLAPVVVSPIRPVTDVHESASFEQQPSQPQPAPSQPQPAPSQPASQVPPLKTLQVQTLSLEPSPNAAPSPQGNTYDVSFTRLGKTITGGFTAHVEKLIERILAAMGVGSDSGLQEMLKELFSSDLSFAEERIRRGSVEMVNLIVAASVTSFAETLSTPPSLRLVIDSAVRELHYLPWEWWPTSTSTLLLSSADNSIVRGFKAPAEDLPRPMFAPLRLMSIIPNAPEGRRFTSDNTLKALEELASSTNNLQYRQLVRDEATTENLQRHLDDFRPHIVHFEGYLAASLMPQHDKELEYAGHYLMLSGQTLDVEAFGKLLRAAAVSLVVFGRNGVSRIYDNPCTDAVFRMAKQGLSVIAPLRAIDDASATIFTAELYRAFLQVNKLEPALHLARRNLASKGGDWTVFALFTDPSRLQYLELLPTLS